MRPWANEVGSAYPNVGPNRRPLAMHWDGLSWSYVPTPNPRLEQAQHLSDVDGVSGTDVWAVGDYSRNHPLALHWDGASWSVVDVPGEGLLLGVAAAASDVRAVGLAGSGQALVERWDGSSWSIQDPPPAHTSPSGLADVAARPVVVRRFRLRRESAKLAGDSSTCCTGRRSSWRGAG